MTTPTLADECAARVHDRARQAAARIIDREEAMTTQDAAQGTSGVEALARVLRAVGVEIGYAGAETYRRVVAERILADPGPLLAALPDEAIEAECIRRFYPQRHVLGSNPQWQEAQP